MRTVIPDPLPSPQEAGDGYDARADMHRLAANALAWGVGGVGLVVLLAAGFEFTTGDADRMAPTRVGLGVLLLAASVLGHRLRRERPALMLAVLLGVVALALAGVAYSLRLGVHMLALSAWSVVLMVAGATLGLRAAAVAFAAFVAVLAALGLAEQWGWIEGQALAAQMSTQSRLIGHLLVGVAAWVGAWVLARVVGSVLGHAKAENDRVADLLHLGSDWTWEMDARARVTAVSPSFELCTGLAASEVLRLGQPGGPVMVPDDDWQALREDLQACRGFRNRRVTVRTASGRTLTAVTSGKPVYDAAGRFTGWRGVSRDVTALRRAEQELEAAKGQAEAASAAKSAFLATMSHEIRTPLNGVLGLARLLQEVPEGSPRRAEYLRHLVDSAELLSGIVSDVLDLSKIEAGYLHIEHVGFDLHELVQTTFQTFARLAQERGLRMDSSIGAGVPRHVLGDPVRVRQILANFLGNALKFTARGSVSLQARTTPSGAIRLAVQDTGPGVSAQVKPLLFKPFAQADGSTTRRFGGTGLGLSICRELTERMGGAIGLESDGASGSLFWVELPLPAQSAGAAGAGLPTTGAALPLAGLSVLVAEDNAVNMLIVAAMLRQMGAEVLEAADGEEAVVVAVEHAARLGAMLMDLHMPGLDGLAATRRLRAEPATRTLPIFAFSAAVLDNERREAEAAGTNGFITKPAAEAELLRALRPLLPAPIEVHARPPEGKPPPAPPPGRPIIVA